MQVAEHQTNAFISDVALDGLVGGVGGNARVALAFEKLAQLFDDHFLIIDHQDLHLA